MASQLVLLWARNRFSLAIAVRREYIEVRQDFYLELGIAHGRALRQGRLVAGCWLIASRTYPGPGFPPAPIWKRR